MYSKFLNLDFKDITRGAVVAVIVVVLGALEQAFNAHGLNVSAFDWAGILNTAFTALIAYLGKNVVSDENGKVLGKIG